MQLIPTEKQSCFEIISISARNYGYFFKNFFLISFLSAVIYAAMSIGANILMQSNHILLSVLIIFLSFIVSFIFSSAIYYFIFLCINLQKPTIKDSIDIGLKRFFSVFIATYLAFILMMGGFLFLIIPGIIFWIYIVFYQALIVIYDYKSTEGIFYSYRLVKNNWWFTLGVLLISYLLVLLPVILYAIINYYYFTSVPLLGNQIFISVLLCIYQIIFVPFMIFIVLHLILDLQVRKNIENARDEARNAI